MLHDARNRVMERLAKDPLFWVLLVIAVFALIRFLNDGIRLAYDAEHYLWYIASANIPFLPGSANGFGYSELAVAVSLVILISGCRHALGKSARYAFCLVSSLISGCFALYLIFNYSSGDSVLAKLVMCTSDCPVYLGSAFGVYLAVSVIALVATFERHWYLMVPFAIIAILGNALGLFVFAPPLSAIIFGVVVVLVFGYSFVYIKLRLGSYNEFKFMVIFFSTLSIATVVLIALMPSEDMTTKLAAYNEGILTKEFFAIRRTLSDFAFKVWKTCPWLGSGLGSYAIDYKFFAGATEWKIVPPLQSAPLNGYWLLLLERGTIGAFIMACPLVLMAITYVRRLIGGLKLSFPNPMAFIGLLLLLAMMGEAAFNVNILSPWMISAVIPMFALSASSFLKEKKENVRQTALL